jgi:hypothetical protein
MEFNAARNLQRCKGGSMETMLAMQNRSNQMAAGTNLSSEEPQGVSGDLWPDEGNMCGDASYPEMEHAATASIADEPNICGDASYASLAEEQPVSVNIGTDEALWPDEGNMCGDASYPAMEYSAAASVEDEPNICGDASYRLPEAVPAVAEEPARASIISLILPPRPTNLAA